MPEVNVEIDGKKFRMACEDGQEEHLMELAERFNRTVIGLKGSFGEIGDNRLVVMAGIVVNNAIVLVDAANQLRAEGRAKIDALVEAGRLRMRPILMTTLTTVIGLAPMALGIGEGMELRAPLAITLIGGLTFATALTLIVIPAVYVTLDRGR